MVEGLVTSHREAAWHRASATSRIDRTQNSMEVLYDAKEKMDFTVDQAIAIAQVEATLAVAEATLELLDGLKRMDL